LIWHDDFPFSCQNESEQNQTTQNDIVIMNHFRFEKQIAKSMTEKAKVIQTTASRKGRLLGRCPKPRKGNHSL
jgi:hypothetical protein